MATKNVLITGGARGIGRSLSRGFLAKGHRVYILDIDEEELRHTADVHLKEHSSQTGSAVCNLRDVQNIREKVQDAAKFFGGRIDVVINNAGIGTSILERQQNNGSIRVSHSCKHSQPNKTNRHETIDQWQAYTETNLTAPFAVSQASIPFMKSSSAEAASEAAINTPTDDAGPCIILVGSFRSQQSDKNQEGYASTKAGEIGLMHSMAISLSDFGIRVNMISPGRIVVAHESKNGEEDGVTWKDAITEEDVELHPTNRPGRPEDIVGAADYLIHAGFVTGQNLVVDGGALRVKVKA